MKRLSGKLDFFRHITGKTTTSVRKYWYRACQHKPVAIVSDWLTRFGSYRITSRAAEIAFYLLLAIFPFTIFLISLFGMIGRSSLIREDLLLNLQGLMPEAVFMVIRSILHEIAGSRNLTFLSFSMIGVAWAASKGFSAILRGLNQIYHTGRPLPSLILRLLGLLFAVALVIAVVLVMALITFGDILFHQLALLSGYDFLSGNLLLIGRYVVSFLLLLLLFSLLYFLASKRVLPWRWSLPAATFTSLSWLLFSLLFSFYVGNATRFTSLYGSLAGVMILMLWLYFSSIVVLSGGIIHEMMIDARKD